MSFFQDWLIPLLENYGLLIVFLTMVAESACIPIPSEIVVPYGGFLAARGLTQLWMVIAIATVANLIGSSIAYAVGRYGGRALFLKYGRYVLVSPHHLDRLTRTLLYAHPAAYTLVLIDLYTERPRYDRRVAQVSKLAALKRFRHDFLPLGF